MPKRDSEPSGNSGRTADDEARLEIGEKQDEVGVAAHSCFGSAGRLRGFPYQRQRGQGLGGLGGGWHGVFALGTGGRGQ